MNYKYIVNYLFSSFENGLLNRDTIPLSTLVSSSISEMICSGFFIPVFFLVFDAFNFTIFLLFVMALNFWQIYFQDRHTASFPPYQYYDNDELQVRQ